MVGSPGLVCGCSKGANNYRPHWNPECPFYVSPLETEIKRLRTIVDRLPKFANGVIAEHGDEGWHPTESNPGIFSVLSSLVANDEWGADVSECYSTKQAAEAESKD